MPFGGKGKPGFTGPGLDPRTSKNYVQRIPSHDYDNFLSFHEGRVIENAKILTYQKRMLKLMIVDCEYHHMTERESLSYIRRQFGRRVLITIIKIWFTMVRIVKSGLLLNGSGVCI
jgi:hypothetical protein